MVKKDYNINIIKADEIKSSSNITQQIKKINSNYKSGFLIGGFISFFLAVCFFIVTIYFLKITYNPDNDATKAMTLIVFILSIGWLCFIPGVFCSILSLCLNAIVIKSNVFSQKAYGIIFTILSILLIILYLLSTLFIISITK